MFVNYKNTLNMKVNKLIGKGMIALAACFMGGVSKRRILFFYKQSPDFHKPGLCHVQKILYL